MSVTDNRVGYAARMTTPYFNTTGMCIELFFWITQQTTLSTLFEEGNGTRVDILVIDEELNEFRLRHSRGWDYVDFRRMFVRLPDGIHRVAIDGIRDSSPMLCGISLDDIAIMDCHMFGELHVKYLAANSS